MIDVSTLRAPGWQRLVADLAVPLPDDRVFLLRMLTALAQASGAKQGVLHQVHGAEGTPEVRPVQVWPLPADVVDGQGRLSVTMEQAMDPSRLDASIIERAKDAAAAARGVAASRLVQVFSLDDGQFYDGREGAAGGTAKAFLIGVPLVSGLAHEASTLALRGVVTLLVEARSRQAIQSMLAVVELLAGYAFTHEAQQALRRTKQASASLDLAARLISGMNASSSFKGASLQLVNDLCRQLGVDRVGLGWVQGSPAVWRNANASERPEQRELHLTALSDTERIDRRMELCRRMEAAMEECLDQEQTVLFPPPSAGSDAALSQSIIHAHRELAKGDVSLRLASFPLRVVDGRGERIVGVMLLESSGAARLDPVAVELVQATLDLVVPVLAVRASDDRHLGLRAWDSTLRAGAWLVGPRHTAWKLAGVACMLATAVLFLGRTTYRVGSPCELRAQERRTIASPVNAALETISEGVKPGRDVHAGEVLAQLDTRETRLQAMELAAQQAQYEKQADEALRKGNQAESAQARARADQARARRELLELQIEKSTIRAPIAGTIIAGDIKDKLGATLKQGDVLFEVADRGTMMVNARVEDRDISFIRPGQTGEMSPKANPALSVPFVVEQIVPLSEARDGVNAYDVRCTFTSARPEAWFLPGLEGQAKFNTQKKSFAWILSRRVVDQLRVWLWW